MALSSPSPAAPQQHTDFRLGATAPRASLWIPTDWFLLPGARGHPPAVEWVTQSHGTVPFTRPLVQLKKGQAMFRDQFACEPNEASLDCVDPTQPGQLTAQAPRPKRGWWAPLGPPALSKSLRLDQTILGHCPTTQGL